MSSDLVENTSELPIFHLVLSNEEEIPIDRRTIKYCKNLIRLYNDFHSENEITPDIDYTKVFSAESVIIPPDLPVNFPSRHILPPLASSDICKFIIGFYNKLFAEMDKLSDRSEKIALVEQFDGTDETLIAKRVSEPSLRYFILNDEIRNYISLLMDATNFGYTSPENSDEHREEIAIMIENQAHWEACKKYFTGKHALQCEAYAPELLGGQVEENTMFYNEYYRLTTQHTLAYKEDPPLRRLSNDQLNEINKMKISGFSDEEIQDYRDNASGVTKPNREERIAQYLKDESTFWNVRVPEIFADSKRIIDKRRKEFEDEVAKWTTHFTKEAASAKTRPYFLSHRIEQIQHVAHYLGVMECITAVDFLFLVECANMKLPVEMRISDCARDDVPMLKRAGDYYIMKHRKELEEGDKSDNKEDVADEEEEDEADEAADEDEEENNNNVEVLDEDNGEDGEDESEEDN